MDFKGMTALVTGASNGIGAETAARLGAGGAAVIVHYYSAAAEAERVLARVREAGGSGFAVQADLTTMAGTRAFIEQVRPHPVDILVNNAGSLIRRTGTLAMSEEIWEQTMMLNVTSAFFLTQAVLPGMLERGRGYVVNVSSVAAKT
ncbi:MAG TPA: oxidoreductase, partial [Solibacterales bacterium]|nr:oxidoreductase [Bryobacterales bacterium]